MNWRWRPGRWCLIVVAIAVAALIGFAGPPATDVAAAELFADGSTASNPASSGAPLSAVTHAAGSVVQPVTHAVGSATGAVEPVSKSAPASAPTQSASSKPTSGSAGPATSASAPPA